MFKPTRIKVAQFMLALSMVALFLGTPSIVTVEAGNVDPPVTILGDCSATGSDNCPH